MVARLPPLFVVSLVALAYSTQVAAKRFENSYVSFDLPNDWSCQLEETEWVCRPPANPGGKYAMMVILTAKYVGAADSPQTYIREIERLGRQPGVEVVSAHTERLLGDAIWLDATLANSEVAGYRTRYLARTEGRVGVLVTFSAHSSVADQANSISDAIAKSVAVNSAAVRPELQRP